MEARKIVGAIILTAIVGAAFWYGSRADNPVSNLVWPPSPTPTPDVRVKMGKEVKAGDLKLKVVDAIRVLRPTSSEDLGVITVRFAGTSDCDDELAGSCRFDTSKFSLVDESGNNQTVTTPPAKYIPGFKALQLVASRQLIKLTSEEGQIYYTLNKASKGFTLAYIANDSSQVKVYIEPREYTNDEVKKNLSTTPNPYGKAEEVIN